MKCADCPIGDTPCIAETTGHRRYCDWARMGGDHHAAVLRLSAELPPNAPLPIPWPSTAAHEPTPLDPLNLPPLTVDASRALLKARNACPDIGPAADCGCDDLRKCRRTGLMVNTRECFACLLTRELCPR